MQDDTILSLLYSGRESFAARPAITAPGAPPLSYGELLSLIEEAGAELQRAGIAAADRVAVVLPNGPLMATVALSLMGHASCAPLNPAYREEEFRFYLEDLMPRAVVLAAGDHGMVAGVARELGIPTIQVEPENGAAGRFRISAIPGESASLGNTSQADHEALVLHTSGTTSRPKMVPLSQRNLVCSARNVAATLRLRSEDRGLSVMPLFHIHGLVASLLAPLAVGGSVCCAPGFLADRFLGWLKDEGISWYSAVPTIHQAVLDLLEKGATVATGLRLIRSSSAALSPIILQQLETAFSVPVIEAYGMTEAAHQMASNPLPPAPRKPGSVGLPAGPEVAIMDPEGMLLGSEEEGEIVIRGANVMVGYHNNPEANSQAFSSSWFRTGDQGWLDREGYLFITGRLKEIINRGGEKIAPREIDDLLMTHPGIRQAVTFALPHPTLGEDIAVAVMSDDSSLSEQGVREFLFRNLADFKVPSQVVFLETIPKGPTGKVQRIGLAEKLQAALSPPYEPPADEVESVLAELMAGLVVTERIGRRDNFFSLGGDSLKGMRLITRINELFELELPVTTPFHHPTIAGLAAVLIENSLQTPGSLLHRLQGKVERRYSEKSGES
jgi:acyl-CoA synthetase (AMP-forming)/AMP-acid ligase II/acyl carrier protein